MQPAMQVVIVGAALAAAAAARGDEHELDVADRAIERAIAYLSKEVPAWREENGCFSCHNNGDGARALYMARRLGHAIDAAALAETAQWLRKPEAWQATGREEAGDSGEKLAAVQFSAALLESLRTGSAKEIEGDDRRDLIHAARLVAEGQHEDGAWIIGAKGSLGAPATYGAFLATALSLDVLKVADDPQFHDAIEKAESWLRSNRPQSTLDASASLLGLAEASDDAAIAQQRRCLKLLRASQQDGGGWGPFAKSPPEPFDTAIALLALSKTPADATIREMIQRGRRHLAATQLEAGSWPETTRPPGAVSYAQHISTTAWALQALLATRQTQSLK
jgi:hypothetical protein